MLELLKNNPSVSRSRHADAPSPLSASQTSPHTVGSDPLHKGALANGVRSPLTPTVSSSSEAKDLGGYGARYINIIW